VSAAPAAANSPPTKIDAVTARPMLFLIASFILGIKFWGLAPIRVFVCWNSRLRQAEVHKSQEGLPEKPFNCGGGIAAAIARSDWLIDRNRKAAPSQIPARRLPARACPLARPPEAEGPCMLAGRPPEADPGEAGGRSPESKDPQLTTRNPQPGLPIP
jgi:hypothetical protein